MQLALLCLKIFLGRTVDVTLSTFVTIFAVKGERVKAAILGFIDALIWFLIVKQALSNTFDSLWIAISYAGGHTLGTFIGTTLTSTIIKGNISVQVIMDEIPDEEIDKIRDAGYAVSQIDCKGKGNSKKLMLFIEVEKSHLKDLKRIITKIDKNAFIVVNETKYVENGFFK